MDINCISEQDLVWLHWNSLDQSDDRVSLFNKSWCHFCSGKNLCSNKNVSFFMICKMPSADRDRIASPTAPYLFRITYHYQWDILDRTFEYIPHILPQSSDSDVVGSGHLSVQWCLGRWGSALCAHHHNNHHDTEKIKQIPRFWSFYFTAKEVTHSLLFQMRGLSPL